MDHNSVAFLSVCLEQNVFLEVLDWPPLGHHALVIRVPRETL